MSASNYFTILTAVQSGIQNLGFTYNGVAVPVVIRKLPTAQQKLDSLPLIAVSPSVQPFTWKHADFEGNQEVVYNVQISIIVAGDRDFSANNLDAENYWYESIRTKFSKAPLSGVSIVWKCEIKPGKIYDRGNLQKTYDYLPQDAKFTTIEPGPNS